MKKISIGLLIMSFLALACTNTISQKPANVINFDSGFSLYQDTIFVDIKGEMTRALKYHDKFYVLFDELRLYGGSGKKRVYIFSNGKLEKVLDCPQKIGTWPFDFFVKNDSIILKPYMEKQFYYLDPQRSIWKEIDKADDLIYEDKKFYVYSLDFGEWGGKTWFKDKKTGIEYVIEAITPLVNKIGTTYYLTNPLKVWKIENPLELTKCDTNMTYENIKTSKKYYSLHDELVGFDVMYEDPDYYSYNLPDKLHIVTSFVWQNELWHIYATDTAAYIAKIENNSIKPRQKIGGNLSFFNLYYSYRCRNLNGNNELLKFRTKNKQLFGLMEIIDNKMFAHYFVNRTELEPKPIGAARADSIFVNRLNLILSDFDNLQLKDVVSAENKWETFNITPDHGLGVDDTWNPNKYLIDTCRSYWIRENSLISNSEIIYFATKANDLVRTIIIDWGEPNLQKFKFLKDYITQKVGKPIENRSEEDETKIIWETSNGLKLELYSNIYGISLAIYKKKMQ